MDCNLLANVTCATFCFVINRRFELCNWLSKRLSDLIADSQIATLSTNHKWPDSTMTGYNL